MEDVKRFLLVLVWRGSGEKGILQALGLIQTYCGRVQNETGLQFLKTGHETGLKRHLLESEIGKRYLLVLVWRGSGEKGFLQALGLIQTYCGRVQNERAVVRCLYWSQSLEDPT